MSQTLLGRPTCISQSAMPPEKYQEEMSHQWWVEYAQSLKPWTWLTPSCGTSQCRNLDHIVTESPKKLAYPYGVCIYCGCPGWQKDHLMPRPWTGDAERRHVLTVPACGECNGMIGDAPIFTITERRARAHTSIRRKYRRILEMPEWPVQERARLGHTLRQSIEKGVKQRAMVHARLEWPDDPAFDLRALELSGIADPLSSGVLR